MMIDLSHIQANLPDFEPGTVWLVGAGPGDPGLLTLAGLFALRAADVIVYDALVSEAILDLANPLAEKQFAGKRGGRPSHVQVDITLSLIEHAKVGKRVLRLKGGDPYVFGRGAEETLALAEADIRYRIVPGITSGLGGLASAAIPATTRDTNHAVILMTGHPAAGEEGVDHVDWAAFAATGAPLILYMSMGNLAAISDELRKAGMAADTAVAVVTDATTERQRVLVTDLAHAVADVTTAGMKAPAIIAIGSIVKVREALVAHAIGPLGAVL